MTSRLELPHTPRVAGVAFLLYMAYGHLPALFALPAGLGDIAADFAAPLVARWLAQGAGRRAALWFNAFGMTDIVVALTLGALTGFQLLNITPSSAPIAQLPLALIPTATVPLLFTLHITAMYALRAPRTARPVTTPLTAPAKYGEADAARDRGAQAGGGLAGRRRANSCRAHQPAHGRRACQEGTEYFAARSDAAPADALWLALAAAFESRFEPQGSLNSRRACMSPRD